MSRNVQIRTNEGFRRPGDIGQGDRFEGGYVESRAALADASYQGYGAYATLDGSRVDSHEYADLDWTGVELEPDRPAARATERDYTGRGPRGYRRSDDSIREDLCERLLAHGEIDASEVEVAVANGEVLLTGEVDSRTTKRAIEDLAYRVSGVFDVNNLLRIGLARPDREPLAGEDDRARERGPVSTHKDDHPSRRDAWMNEHLRDRGSTLEQVDRARERRNLRDYAWTGPHDTSAEERIDSSLDSTPARFRLRR
jgi:hypothetical protein